MTTLSLPSPDVAQCARLGGMPEDRQRRRATTPASASADEHAVAARHNPVNASWLTMETTGSTALSPGNSPPTEITHGEFNSPRDCRGTFGSVGTAEATRMEADFTGTDCQLATFTGRVVLTKW